ncbi:MAG: antibiotic biosynthesis monooxygenase [Acidobacteriales bacterium]|nr:antibiotic biosynthesis monooxygenase [Terriglobales bacterium]
MIARLWHGYTTHQNAAAYQRLLETEILPGIRAAHRCRIDLLRREHPDESEFITICYFETLDEIKAFAGDDYEQCVVPDSARKLLKHFDQRSQHYEVLRQE